MFSSRVRENNRDIVQEDAELKRLSDERAWVTRVRRAILSNDRVDFRRNKLMFIGNGGAGKTSTLKSLLGIKFSKKHNSTLVADNDQQVELYTGNIANWEQVKQKSGEHLLRGDFTSILQVANRGGSLQRKQQCLQETMVPVNEKTKNETIEKNQVRKFLSWWIQ